MRTMRTPIRELYHTVVSTCAQIHPCEFHEKLRANCLSSRVAVNEDQTTQV